MRTKTIKLKFRVLKGFTPKRPDDDQRWGQTHEALGPELLYAIGCKDPTIEIKVGFHYNGSGAQAFGGAKQWPHVALHMNFPTHRQDLANSFAEELQKLALAFVENHPELKP